MLVDLHSHLARFVGRTHYQVVTHSFIERKASNTCIAIIVSLSYES